MSSIILAFLATQVLGVTLHPRQSSSNTAVVDLSIKRGTPQHLASGFIYGIPDTSVNQIPAHFYQDIGFNYARVGGAQLDQGGWIMGKTAYEARLNSTYNNYLTSREYGAKVIILPHDIWGTDHANSSTHWPGDNGDWTDYDNFLNTLISDLKRLNMLDSLVYDIWNEPDGSGFWARSEAQYLDMYVRTHKRLRQDASLNGVLISGPSSAGQPSLNNNWWTTWLQRVVQDNVIPDQYAWHDEPGDPANDANNFTPLLQKYSAPSRPVNINEYATFDQQTSVGAAWWISRLERLNYIGLRGNWLSKCQLRDFMASLLGKSDTNSCTGTGYYGNGEFQVYKYYNRNMTGIRAGTTGSGDGVMDVYATIGSDKVRTLTGCTNTGTYYVTINKLSSVGLPTSGTLNIQTYGLIDQGHFGRVDAPTDRGVYGHTYSGDSVTFPVYQTTQGQKTAWAFEFSVAK
ncbi:hypothetical protein CB0940_02190 [Cercospora beticola]|uniref:Beta-xylosidase n=1 Tax=Cercospora beticola TaxID=122368 RepID=A0A2G5ICJ2_CERBT|nr:hypothetical protein CB0940_02190 [Cercospora beticola]PIB02528.1 hypothetical protein CB0940_02190 [Cercospora beticola]WPA97671.1 hypothetical protein RHO25_002282 [Cercospora beticola]CAK1358865.1 unnamed protein product [Cercospora beticola]